MVKRTCAIFLIPILLPICFAQAEDVVLALQMPGHTFSPGMPCKLDLKI